MTVPPLTPEQRADALAKAALARTRRAEVKAALKSGSLTLASVLAGSRHDEALQRLRVADLLTSLPGVGPARATSAMERLGIASSRRVRGLGVHQTAGLLAEFGAA